MCEHRINLYVIPPQPIFVSKQINVHLRLLYSFALQIKLEHRWRNGFLNELIPDLPQITAVEVPATRNHLEIQFVVKLHIKIRIKKSHH
jgi:hypothetical protein